MTNTIVFCDICGNQIKSDHFTLNTPEINNTKITQVKKLLSINDFCIDCACEIEIVINKIKTNELN